MTVCKNPKNGDLNPKCDSTSGLSPIGLMIFIRDTYRLVPENFVGYMDITS